MIEKETLNLLRESINRSLLQIKCLYKILELNILIFLHRLDNSWPKMRLLLDLIGLPLDHLLYLFLLLCILNKELLPLLIGFIEYLE
jgi:hypothetical protein